MLRDIDRISADAAGDGLADFSALQTLLGDTAEVKGLFTKWYDIFPKMEAAAKQLIKEPTSIKKDEFFGAYTSFLSTSRENNTTFVRLCLREYEKRLV
jgi:hypothetical protein